MTTVITRGAGSAQALGYAARATAANYIEDVFSTYLYTGNGSTQTITNGIDLSTKGGLVWIKNRGSAVNHALVDTSRGAGQYLSSNTTTANTSTASEFTGFTTSGFGLDSLVSSIFNGNNETYTSWTFRKQAKFFDVVTYTGNDTDGRTVAHNLGSVPGCIIIKRTDQTADWQVYHRSIGNTNYLVLNTTAAEATSANRWNNTTPTDTVFTLGKGVTVNANGGTYVAYLFAHDAGGFGASGSDNVISCGSFTSTSGISSISLGYEPQWVLIKRTNGVDSWWLIDNMRGFSVTSYARLFPNTSGAESVASGPYITPTSTGFTFDGSVLGAANTYIYIAIRRGPMRTPTSGTSVFASAQATSNGTSSTWTTNFPVDLALFRQTAVTETGSFNVFDRLRGKSAYGLLTAATDAESSYSGAAFDLQTTFQETLGYTSSRNLILEAFRRAPGFFDVVCYTGNGTSGATQSHNLAAVPEMWIVKRRSTADYWVVGTSARGSNVVELNTNGAEYDAGTAYFSNGSSYTAPTSTAIRLGSNARVNASGDTYVAYLFATVAGVSKVGSYTGTGTTLQVNCGFTGGARFVLIKRTDSTGDWYVWDSARGIVAGNDPYLLLNSTAAEVTGTDYVDTYSAGFEISSTAPAAINQNGGTFVYLAIA